MLMYIRNVMKREEGATAVEYGLLVAAIAAVIVVIVFSLGSVLKDKFQTTCDKISQGGTTSTVACNS